MLILRRSICLFLATILTLCIFPLSASADVIEPMADSDFTILWTSDPQWYSFKYQNILIDQNDWVVENYERMNMQYIIHTGDFVDLPHNRDQWNFITEQYKKWDDAGLAYGVLAGNHDVDGTDYTEFKEYFGTHRFADNAWFGEAYDGNRGHYDLMTMGEVDFIFVYLGYGTHSAEDYEWMNAVLAEHSDRIAFLMFHEYLNADGTRTAVGDAIFNEVVLKNPNVRMVLCGHNYNATRLVEYIDDNGDGKEDRTVYQLMANYQNLPNGGNGYMRFLECDVDAGTISQRTFSPYLDDFNAYDNRGDELDEFGYRDEFTLPFDFSKPESKAQGDPDKGTVIINSTVNFGDISLPLSYINTKAEGKFSNAGLYDRSFSLDARDATDTPDGVSYITVQYKDKEGFCVSQILKGGDSIASIPWNGRAIVIANDAKDKNGNPFDIESISVGQPVTFSQISGVAPTDGDTHIKIRFKGLDGTFGIDGANRDANADEWILFDRSWGESTLKDGVDNKWNIVIAFEPVEGKDGRYTLTDISAESGEEKNVLIPENGFALAINTASCESSLRNSMREIFVNRLEVILYGYEPNKGLVYSGESIISKNTDDWDFDKSVMAGEKGDDGALVFYNTNGQWPDARYYLNEDITFDPKSTSLYYDLTVEEGSKTSIVLFFNQSSPANPVSGQYHAINSYLANVTISSGSGDVVGNGEATVGTLDLSTVDFPEGCYNADGTLTLKAIKVFASGNANKSVAIRELRMIEGNAEEEIPEDFLQSEGSEASEISDISTATENSIIEKDTEETDNGSTTVIIAIATVIAVIAVAAVAVILKKRK